MKKASLTFKFNSCKKRLMSFDFRINNSNYSASIYQNGFLLKINYSSKPRNDAESIIKTQCRIEIVKRLSTAYTLLTSKVFNLKKLSYKWSYEDAFSALDGFKLFSLFEMYNVSIPNNPSPQIIEKLITTPVTKQGRDLVAINSYLIAKAKKSEIEKLIYYWASFNAVYSSLYGATGKQPCDKKALNHLFRKLENKDESVSMPTKDKHDQFCKEVSYLFSNNSETVYDSIMFKMANDEQYKVYEYVDDFILLDFAYYLRCNYFHGTKSLPLYSFGDDSEISALKCVNEHLEKYLDKNVFRIEELKKQYE